MTDHDDLFEFEDFEDTDLDLDLDELFGDLETLAIDVSTAGLPAPAPAEPVAAAPAVEPIAAAPVPAPAAPVAAEVPAAPAPTAQPQPAPVAAAQPAAPLPGVQHVAHQPIAAEQIAGLAADPGLLQPKPSARVRLTKTSLALGAAAVVTLANLAAMAIPHLASDDGGQQRQDPNDQPTPVVSTHEATDAELALLDRVDQLERQLRGLDSPTAGITPSRGEYNWVIDEARSMIERGDIVGARKRLYSLLAIIDRLPTHERDLNEAAASYLLADTYKLEAQVSTQEAGL